MSLPTQIHEAEESLHSLSKHKFCRKKESELKATFASQPSSNLFPSYTAHDEKRQNYSKALFPTTYTRVLVRL